MSDLRGKLESKLKQTTNSALAQGLRDGTSDDFKNAVDEVERYSKLLEATQHNWTRDAGAAIGVALAVLLVAGLLWSCKLRTTNISLTAEASNLHLTTGRDWRVDDLLKGQNIRINHLSSLHNPSLGLSLDDSDSNIWLRVAGTQIALHSLEITAGATVNLNANENNLTMSISRSPFDGVLSIVGTGVLTAGNADGETFKRPYNLEIPETLQFSIQRPQMASSDIEISAPQAWSLGIVPCKSLGFSYELRSLDEREVISGLRSAKLQFNDVAWPAKELGESQLLSLELTSSSQTQIRSGAQVMHVTVNGRANDVQVGDVGERHKIAPSYLEYLYDRKSLILFWTAVVAGWGLLWGIRKTIFH
jgi:hypothetical protein